MNRFSSQEISTLKKRAKAIKKAAGCSHAEALDKVARENDWDNWSLLQKHALKDTGALRPAHVFEDRVQPSGTRLIKVAVVRYRPLRDEDPGKPGQLVFRCPECGEIHYHGAVDHYLGAGDGDRVPHCANRPANYVFDLVEVEKTSFAGDLPKKILRHVKPPVNPERIKDWFASTHTLAVDRSPWEGREGGYQYPLYEYPFEIQAILHEEFPNVDEEALFGIAEDLFEEGPWIEASFLDALDNQPDDL